MSEIVEFKTRALATKSGGLALPAVIEALGPDGIEAFLNYFAAKIENANTRQAYARAWVQFGVYLKKHQVTNLAQVRTLHVAGYLDELGSSKSKSTVKQHRAALSKCFDFLVVAQTVPENPVTVVSGPKIKLAKGKTPTLTDDEFLDLLDSIDTSKLSGLRDKAFIAILVYTWSRVSATVGLSVGDYFAQGKRWYIRQEEKGGVENKAPLHHLGQEFLDEYIKEAGIADESEMPLFRSFNRQRELTDRALDRREALAMIKRRAKSAGIQNWRKISNHSFRATGITNYMANGGRLDVAQELANHADSRTTAMYDHSADKVNQEEVERIRFEREHTK